MYSTLYSNQMVYLMPWQRNKQVHAVAEIVHSVESSLRTALWFLYFYYFLLFILI